MKTSIALLAATCLLLACGDKAATKVASSSTPETKAATPPPPPAPPPPPTPKKWDGPLGLVKGLTRAEVEAAGITFEANPYEANILKSKTTPTPNKNFDQVNYIFGKTTGLCKVLATTPVTEANRSGDQIKSKFDELESALVEKYGKPKEGKFAKAGALWKEDKWWMQALSSKERMHTSLWPDKDKSVLPQGVEGILLNAVALDSNKGYVELIYEYDNIDACIKELKKADNDSL